MSTEKPCFGTQVEWHLAILPLTLVERLIPPAARSIRSNPQARRLVPFGFAVTVACLILPFLITLLCSRTRVSNLSPPTLNNSGVPYGCQHSGAG